MRIDPASHLISGIHYVPSPNADERDDNYELSLIVIHNISLPPNEFGGPFIEQFFTNQLDPKTHPYFSEITKQKVSAHILIRRDGEVVQFVPFNRRAWHAGKSSYEGKECCNDFSIGIELEGADDVVYEDEQYRVLATLVDALRTAYPNLNKNRITGHSDIAPGRKTDPGLAFKWKKLHDLLA